MQRGVLLSLIATSFLYAQDIVLDPVSVDATTLDEVSTNAKVSADLSEVLSQDIPSIDMSRRSGIANDVIIRGLKRDNISVTVDGTKTYGACPNRMDPPVSHVLSNNIQSVEVIEGPYDVSEYGTLGGGVKVKTLDPQKGAHGDFSFGGGSWNYKKLSATLTGGNDTIRFLIAGSSEDSDQYVDGDGNTLAEQVANYAQEHPAVAGNAYKTQYEDMQAYSKKSFMAKLFINPTQNQELRFSYTANRSDDVMYPNSPMDAYYDDSDIYNIEYEIKDITSWYKSVTLQFYSSDVDHPMGIQYRKSSMMMGNKVNHMWSSMDAWRLKNRFDFDGYVTDFGLEYGQRNWDGSYYVNDNYVAKSLDNVDTDNISAYLKVAKRFGALDVSVGARYDDSEITPDSTTLPTNDYNSVSANIFTTYALDQANKIFFGFGQAQRVPDARELYFKKSGTLIGTPTLDQVTNREFDLGYNYEGENGALKIKTFYSMLSDYIYFNSSKAQNKFENVDATIYGVELSGSYYVTDIISLEGSASYKRGKKDNALSGQSDTDLADITPLQGKVGIVYEYAPRSYARIDIQARDRWKDIDSDNGEQELASWAVVDFKAKHSFNPNIDMTVGINNILDKTYIRSNSYADLTLVSAGGEEKLLLNEPGRYVYMNFDLHF